MSIRMLINVGSVVFLGDKETKKDIYVSLNYECDHTSRLWRLDKIVCRMNSLFHICKINLAIGVYLDNRDIKFK